MADEAEDLRARLDEAHAAADRLVREATRQAAGVAGDPASHVPPRGWETPGTSEPRDSFSLPELDSLRALLDLGRTAVPPELRRQFIAAVRELLLALRALIDFYVERLESGARPPAEVEDIPIQ
jgi:hypothetical protein